MDKSKIMVFRQGGGKIKEEWKINGEVVEVVNNYGYLGVKLTPRLFFSSHFIEKRRAARAAINTAWQQVLAKANLPLSSKVRIYEGVVQSILTYGAQVWGLAKFKEVEEVRRFFIKKMVNIPSYCPNYMLDLETNIEHVYLFTMKLHKKYVKRVLEYEEGRLPKFLLQEMIRANCGWRRDWENLGERWEVEFNTEWENRNFWEHKLEQVIGAIRVGIRERALERATRSSFCNHYRELMGLNDIR